MRRSPDSVPEDEWGSHRGCALRGQRLRHLHSLSVPDDGGSQGQGQGACRRVVRQGPQPADPTGRGSRFEPGQARGSLRCARISGAREMRQPLLAHAQCRPGPQRGPGLHGVAMRSHENEPFVVNREVRAVIVPAGVEVKLKPGQAGYITQALGGSFTVYIEGNLFRIAGEDADAIGKEAVKAPELPPNATEEDVKKLAWDQMRTCFDPEIPINIVELGLVYGCEVKSNEDGTRTVEIELTLTAPGCGMGDILVDDVKDKVQRIPTVREARVELTFDPPWNQSMMSEAARLQTGMF